MAVTTTTNEESNEDDDVNDIPNFGDMSSELRKTHEPTAAECNHCEEGRLFAGVSELVCDHCAIIVDGDALGVSPMPSLREQWDLQLFEGDSRLTHEHSEQVVVPGGFYSAYSGGGIYGSEE